MLDKNNGLVDYTFQAVDEAHIAETEGHGDKILYTPNTEFFAELMYQTGYMLEMAHESKSVVWRHLDSVNSFWLIVFFFF